MKPSADVVPIILWIDREQIRNRIFIWIEFNTWISHSLKYNKLSNTFLHLSWFQSTKERIFLFPFHQLCKSFTSDTFWPNCKSTNVIPAIQSKDMNIAVWTVKSNRLLKFDQIPPKTKPLRDAPLKKNVCFFISLINGRCPPPPLVSIKLCCAFSEKNVKKCENVRHDKKMRKFSEENVYTYHKMLKIL